MLTPSAKPLSGRYLSFAEREEIALLSAQGRKVCEIARHLGQAASTISREPRRNAAASSGDLECCPTTAQWHAERPTRRPKAAKVAVNEKLRIYVQDRLSGLVATPSGHSIRGPDVLLGSARSYRQNKLTRTKRKNDPPVATRMPSCSQSARSGRS
jgi:transposase-like protein